MAYEQRDCTGTLWINDKKEKGDNKPDRKGDCLIDGKPYWLSGWIKKGNGGDPFLSLSFTPKDAQTKPTREPPPSEDEVPF
jgi:hypothetical protein